MLINAHIINRDKRKIIIVFIVYIYDAVETDSYPKAVFYYTR